MTELVDVVNRALQVLGTRTTITALQLTNESNNEAKQANLLLTKTRDRLLRMAPWDCALNTINLTYITSSPGTPENTSPATALWEKGQPPPPWIYEYQYPVDCLKACWVIPGGQTAYAGAVPIYPATVSTGQPATYGIPPVRFKINIDQFFAVTAAAVVAGGTGYAIGDIITLTGTTAGDPPIGAPVQLTVVTAPAGVVATVSVVNQIEGSTSAKGGSYFERQSGTIAQDTTTGSGTGATFTLTQESTASSQRVIVCNQEYATLSYVKQITDPNLMDPSFQDAWEKVLGAGMCMALTGKKDLANDAIKWANMKIEEARKNDANEGLTVNNVIPDFVRVRGYSADAYGYDGVSGVNDWGGLWPMF